MAEFPIGDDKQTQAHVCPMVIVNKNQRFAATVTLPDHNDSHPITVYNMSQVACKVVDQLGKVVLESLPKETHVTFYTHFDYWTENPITRPRYWLISRPYTRFEI